MGKFISPSSVFKPSAIVLVELFFSILPLISDRYASSTLKGSEPITVQFDPKYLAAKALPAIKPPPPTGVKI